MKNMNVLVIDVGGQHVKILLTGRVGAPQVRIGTDDDSA